MLIDLLRAKQSIQSFFASEVTDRKKKACGCGSEEGGCNDHPKPDGYDQVLNKTVSRRKALSTITQGLIVGAGLTQTACSMTTSSESREKTNMKWDEYFKTNYRLMTDKERGETVGRLQKLYEMRTGKTVDIGTDAPVENVLYGYAFNVSKCQGYMDCVNACVEENNQDRSTQMQYIRIHEIENGKVNFDGADDNFFHEVPAAGHFYMGTQCFHCENAPCIEACPVGATWQEEDGIVVIDYDWCIGCRYCMAACPYDGRRFNWKEPEVPEEEINLKQHYLGNRPRKKGVMEKCTFCIQRSRSGKNPACVDACPTGARVFGNLLDPKSQIRWVLENKKVFRLKEELGTEPKFWYFMD